MGRVGMDKEGKETKRQSDCWHEESHILKFKNVYPSGSQLGAIFPPTPREHRAMSEDNFGCHSWG